MTHTYSVVRDYLRPSTLRELADDLACADFTTEEERAAAKELYDAAADGLQWHDGTRLPPFAGAKA